MSIKVNHNHQLKVFIAGSKVLSEQRNILRAVLMRQQGLFNIMIEAKTFEEFSDSLIDGGAQKTLYNKYIASEADIVVFVLDGSVGGFTKEEFYVAYNNYLLYKRPLIYVYCRQGEGATNIMEFKNELASRHQYYTEYADNMELERLFEKSINEYLINTFFIGCIRTPKEQVAFDLACQRLSNMLVSCLNVINELGEIITELNAGWNKFKVEYHSAPNQESQIMCKDELLRGLEHYLNEFQRISRIYPPSSISISEEHIELLASQVKDISEIVMLPTLYSTYFDDALAPFKALQDYLTDMTSSVLKGKMIDLHFNGFYNLANAFFYTSLVYLSQLPEEYQKNLKETQTWWKIFPKNISVNLPIDEYERFAKREFDEYEKRLIELKTVLAVQDEELDNLKRQIDAVANQKVTAEKYD